MVDLGGEQDVFGFKLNKKKYQTTMHSGDLTNAWGFKVKE